MSTPLTDSIGTHGVTGSIICFNLSFVSFYSCGSLLHLEGTSRCFHMSRSQAKVINSAF